VYSVRESQYDENVLRSMNQTKRHRNPILSVTPDYSQEIARANAEKAAIDRTLDDLESERKENASRKSECEQQLSALHGEKQSIDHKLSEFNKLTARLSKKRVDLEELEKDHNDDPTEERNRLTLAIQKLNVDRIEILEKYAEETESMMDQLQRLNASKLAQKHVGEEFKHCLERLKAIRARNEALRRSLDEAVESERRVRRNYQAVLEQTKQRYPRTEYEGKWTEDDEAMTGEDIENELNRLDGRINVLFIDTERVERFRRLTQKIETAEKRLGALQNKQSTKEDRIKDIENKWRPQLQEAVRKISAKFGDFFRQFNSAEGKVELMSHEEGEVRPYSEWCIDILTKFRADQPWKRLTSSSQSGGEKSVSTMLYLLSLQQVTTVPFRVVDEINQGMDPHNERRIMQILNYECTPKRMHRDDDGALRLPQYFVVTPKLLPRLEYSPCSSVYVIFNGPFQMPQEFWNLAHFVHSQMIHSQSPPKGGKRRKRRREDRSAEEEEEAESGDDDDSEDTVQ